VVRIRRPSLHRPDGAAFALAGMIVGLVVFILVLEVLSPGHPARAHRQPADSAPAIVELPDFARIRGVEDRKGEFFGFLHPIIEAENARVAEQRRRMLALRQDFCARPQLAVAELIWLQKLAREYELPWFSPDREADWHELEIRVDLVPAPLALAQAALESAWGTSRLARLSLGLFGEYCFRAGGGIVPENREPGDIREFRVFESVDAAVRSYIHNLNTLPVYRLFWLLRAQQREAGERLDSHVLAAGLLYYSELREEYVRAVRRMLHDNRRSFARLEPLI